MKNVYFYFPSGIHSVDKYKMSLLPEGFSPVSRGYDANFLLESAHKDSGARQKLSKALQPVASGLYNRLHILLNSPKKRKFPSSKYSMI